MTRPNFDEWFLLIAHTVSKRSPCLRRHYGAVIVRDHKIVSFGYNGPPRKSPHCEVCVRDKMGIPHGESYDLCDAVHAEMNALLQAGPLAEGATLYISGEDPKTGSKDINCLPCRICSGLIQNAGITRIVIPYNPVLGSEEDGISETV